MNADNDPQVQMDRIQDAQAEVRAAQREIANYLERLRDSVGAVENRRFALDRAIGFHKNTTPGIVSAQAALHLADMFFDYIDNGTIPDAASSVAAHREFVDTVVRSSFPASVQGDLA